jgi:hypothetical protein
MARVWLIDNVPCSREKFFVELGMLMPSTVRGERGQLLLPQTLLRQAYQRIYGSTLIPETIVLVPNIKHKAKGTTQKILDALRAGRTICKDDFPESKHFQTLLVRAVKKQNLAVEQVAKGKFRLKGTD